MTENDYVQTLDELERLLNDPDVPMQPELIWRLVAEVSEYGLQIGAKLSWSVASGRDTSRYDRSAD
jgi:hypothetical protein